MTRLGDSISGDTILPSRHSFLPGPEMAEQVLSELGADVNRRVRQRPILCAGPAFGYGTGRESPARALAAAGVKALIGGPFARMFYRNAINNGILVVEAPDVYADVEEGSYLRILLADGRIEGLARNWRFAPIPDFVLDVLRAGGLIGYARQRPELLRQGGS